MLILYKLLGLITNNPFGWPRCIGPVGIGKIGRAAVWAEFEAGEVDPKDCYVVIHTMDNDGVIRYYSQHGGGVVVVTHDNDHSTLHFTDVVVRKRVWIYRLFLCYRGTIIVDLHKHQTYLPGDMVHLDFELKASNL